MKPSSCVLSVGKIGGFDCKPPCGIRNKMGSESRGMRNCPLPRRSRCGNGHNPLSPSISMRRVTVPQGLRRRPGPSSVSVFHRDAKRSGEGPVNSQQSPTTVNSQPTPSHPRPPSAKCKKPDETPGPESRKIRVSQLADAVVRPSPKYSEASSSRSRSFSGIDCR